jgi:hypothetical protein
MPSEDFVDALSGTYGIAASADYVMVLDRKRHCDEAILKVTGRDIAEGEYALFFAAAQYLWKLDGCDLKAASDTVETRRDTTELAKLGENTFQVLAMVKGRTETTPDQVAKKFGITNKVAGQLLSRLADKGRIVRTRFGLYAPTPRPVHTREELEVK